MRRGRKERKGEQGDMRRRDERGVLYCPKFQGSKKIVVATDLKQRRAVRREGWEA